MRRRLLLLHLVNGSILVCLLAWLGAQGGMTTSTLAAPAPAALSDDTPRALAMLPTGPAPLPNHVVTSLAANTNPNVPLGGWSTYSTTNSSIGGNDATSIALDAGGRPLVGHPWWSGGGLSVLNSGVWTNYYSPTLVNNGVTAVAVDARNQVWVGSPTYYDINTGSGGAGGITLRSTLGAWSKYLVGTYVSSIAAAGTEVWIGTTGGIARYNASTDPPTPLATFDITSTAGGLASDNILTIVVADMPDPWCGTQPRFYVGHDAGVSVYAYGIVSIHPKICDWAWTNYSSPNSPLPNTSISAIAVDSRKRVWFGSNCCDFGVGSANGLAMLDGGTWVTYTVDNSGLTYNRIAALAADAQGRVWIGQTDFTGGISVLERRPSGLSGALSPATLPATVTLNVFEDGGSTATSDDRWCTYYVGGGSCASPFITAGLPSNHISAIAAAPERIWFGTGDTFYGAGVATLQLNWQSFTTNSGMNSNAVQALWADISTNELWVGEPNGVDRFDGSNWAFYPLATGGYFSSGIRALHRDDAGRLWAGEGLFNGSSYGAVWLYMPNSNTWQPYLAPGTGTLNALSSDALGQNSRLWLATSEALKVFNVSTSAWVTFTTSNSPLVSNNVKAVTRDHAGWMWMGTDGGVSVYTGTGWLSYTVASTAGGLVSDNVRALAGDGLGRMWVGTSAGVSVLSGGTWTAYTVANTGGGLGSNFVQGIALDPAGRVWVATDNGLSMFDGARWTWLNRYRSGLVDDDLRAIAADNQDGVWIGTPQGLSVRGVMPSVIALPAPSINNFTPGSGPVKTIVNIVGTNFAGGLETNRVYFTGPNGTYAEAQIQQRSSGGGLNTLMVELPFNAVKGPIYVSTGGGTAVSAGDFTPLPTVTRYGPVALAQGMTLTVLGANLGGSSSRIRFANNVEAFTLDPLASDRLQVRVPSTTVSGMLTLLTDGGSVTLSPTFTLVTVCAQRTNNSCAPFNDAGAMEINQGLPDTMYPLVAGKETLVRVYLGSSVASGFAAVDLGMLTIIGPNGTSVRFADIPKRTFNNTVRTFSEKANANFYLDGSEIPKSGPYSFIVDLFSFGVNVYHAMLPISLQPTKDLRFVVVNWSDGKPVTPTQQVWDELASEQRAIATLARTYPVRRGVGFTSCANCGVQYTLSAQPAIIPTSLFSSGVPFLICDKVRNYVGFNYVVYTSENTRWWFNHYAGSDFFYNAINFVPARLKPRQSLGCGTSMSDGSFSPGNIQIVTGTGDISAGAIAAQEVAHNFGLVMTGTVNADPTGHSKNEFVLAPSGSVSETRGFNIITRRAITEPHAEMEGFCCFRIEQNDTQLFEPADFPQLSSSILKLNTTGTTVAGASAAAAQPVIYLAGTISLSGTLTRLDSRLMPAGSALTPLAPGPYYLVFLNASNQVLASDGFEVSLDATHGDEPMDTTTFSLARPVPAGTSKVQVRQSGTVLAQYVISAHAPSVSITAPAGGAFGANDNVSVAWNASDVDGNPLTFGLLYSRDDGASWQVIAGGLRGSSATWNTLLSGGTVPGSFSRVKVVASDGFNTAEALSNRFSVAGKPPIVSISAPADDSHFVEGHAVHFEGIANDLEDGVLPGTSLTWSSSRDGVLGNGTARSAVLSVGTHVITLVGMDSNSSTTSSSITITVESDFDGDGIADSAEPDNFWNPDDAGSTIGGVSKLDRASGISSPPTFAPGMVVNPSAVYLTTESGTTSTPYVVTIQSTGASALNWNATKQATWLSLGASSGTTLGALQLSANASGLPSGTYTDTLSIQSGALMRTVAVTLVVTSRGDTGGSRVYLPWIVR